MTRENSHTSGLFEFHIGIGKQVRIPLSCQITALLLLATALFLSACEQENGATWQRVMSEGVLRVGLDPTYPPFESAEAGELEGLDVDLANSLAEELRLQAEFVYFGFDGLYDALATNQVDVLISALVVRPDQTRDFAYSEPYFNAGQVLITSANEESVSRMEDLESKRLAVELGAEGHLVGTEWQRRLRELKVEPYSTADQALEAVQSNDADAALVDSIGGLLFLADHGDLRITGEPVTVEPFALVVRKEDETLLRRLNESLATLERNGELATIRERWLGDN